MSAINLRALIRELIDGGAVDPEEIAAKIAVAIDDADLREVLQETLRTYVREMIGNLRVSLHAGASVASRKVQGQRDAWKDFLSIPVHAGSAGWKALGDCTVADLKLVVEELRVVSARTTEKADKYERLIAFMKVRRATTVRALPPEASDVLRTVTT